MNDDVMNPAGKPLPLRDELAQQHDLIDLRLEDLLVKAHSGVDQPAMCGAVRDLIDAIGMHFGYEESLMAVRAYPEFNHHRRQHLALMIELGLLLDRFEDAKRLDNNLLRCADFLTEWYRRHEAASDRPMIDWLEGVAPIGSL